MKLQGILKLSFNMVVHSKLRSWLTIIGIFIGVAAVVGIISLGQGLQASVNSQIQGLGQDVITISSGGGRAVGPNEGSRSLTPSVPLSDKDILAIKLVSGVKEIDSIISGRSVVRYQEQNASLSIHGDSSGVLKDFITVSIASGRFLSSGEVKSIVIGDSISKKVYKSTLEVGYIVYINDRPFRIVGILQPSSGFGSNDNVVYMSNKDAREVLNNTLTLNANQYSSINVKVSNVGLVNETSNKIQQALSNSRHSTPGKEDFSISSPQALQDRFSSITAGITLFLGIIAGVSLFVGGIGITNTMFTSVLEKTKDIGVMKAIGAKNSDILLIFLFNSGMLGLVGGVLGIIGGVAISYIIPSLGISLGIGRGATATSVISWGLLSFALAFSIIIGMLSGAIPAYRASKLKPVEALRSD